MTGNSTPYTTTDADRLTTALRDGGILSTPTGGNMTATARIEWAGDYNAKPARTVKFTGLTLAPVQAAVADALAARGRADQARPLSSYRAVGWRAQYRQLASTRAGRAAAEAAGVSVSPRTAVAWLSGAQTAQAGTRARIAQAYASIRDREVHAARGEAARAVQRVAEAMTDALRGQYGVEVRLFDPTNIDFP